MDLTDAQWAVLAPSFRPARRPDGRGRPWTDSRAALNGVLWVLRTICRGAIRPIRPAMKRSLHKIWARAQTAHPDSLIGRI
jgi:transposase